MKSYLFPLIACVALGVFGFVLWQETANKPAASVVNTFSRATSGVTGVQIGGAYELTAHTGDRVTDQTFAGQHKLIYFGFTYCPAICPTELSKITAILKRLEGTKVPAIQPLFVTVDPKRDTTSVMKDYVSLFHEDFIGLTGSQSDIDSVKKLIASFHAKSRTRT